MKWVRRLVTLVLTLVVALPVLAGGAYLWLRTSLPDYDGTVAVTGPSAPVEIVRDARAIPHIHAASRDDALFALGFAHAQDRLWQMEMLRRLGQGRLSEIAGEATLGVDRLVRTLGFYRLSEAIVEHMAPDARAALEAYAAGVNAYLETRGGALPPEFVLTGIDPEPWRPADSIVWGKVMTLQLSGNWYGERLRLALARHLSAEQIDDLWPATDGGGAVTLAAHAPLWRRVASLLGRGPIPGGLDRGGGASNEWVVDGRHSASGLPILANDPHLGFQAPNLWYLARLEAPGLSVAGATVPGVPIMLLGQNDHVAWGLTTTNGDTSDLVIERLAPGDPGRYLTPDGARPFTTREEVIALRDGETRRVIIRETRHGPVVSDLWADDNPAEPGHVIALRSTALGDDDLTAQAMMRLHAAGSVAEALESLRDYRAPQQNFVIADDAGSIAFIAAGDLPVRRNGNGFMPVPGWTDAFAWTGMVPFEALPQAVDPPSGRLVNANNAVTGDGYPYFVSREYDAPYRAQRIADLLDDDPGPHTVARSIAMQADILSPAATALLPVLLAAGPGGDRARKAHALLAAWDGRMDRERPEPLIFTAWLRALNRALYEDELADSFERYWNLRADVVLHMLTRRPAWCDDVRTQATEDCGSRISAALDRALDDLAARHGDDPAGWRWGEAHRATFPHRVLDFVPVVRDFASFDIPVGGGWYTLDRNAPDIADEDAPYASVHGAGYRAVYDLADPGQSRVSVAGGQSGNPLSPHYRDMLSAWRDFDYLSLARDRDAVADKGVGTLRLVPR